jgi:TatD DNase family protein
MLIDTHCHLTNGRFAADLPAVIAQADAAGVVQMLTIGTGLKDGRAALAIAAAYPQVACAVALDPASCFEAGDAFDDALADLETLLRGGGFVAVGEFGLEYFHKDTVCLHAVQRDHCARQLDLAARLDLPAILHVRDAHPDMLDLLRAHPDTRGVVHSFSGDAATARHFLDLGWYLSLNGMVTYKGNDALREAARIIPADRLLVETDAPYLSPIPHRGKRCVPDFVSATAAFIADLRGERPDDLAAWTTRNAVLLFDLPDPWATA